MSETPPEQPPNEPDPPRKTPRRRRWFQFGLGTLLVLVALCAVLLAAWRVYLAPYRAQRETMALIERLKGSYQTQAAATWATRLSLAPTHNVVLVNLPDCDEPAEYLDAVSQLPCLETLVVGGLAFGDEHLARLQTLPTLRWLVLDSTNVSAAAENALQKALPNLQLRHSDRRILAGFEARGAEIGSKVSNRSQELLQLVGPEFMESDTRLFFEGGEITDTDLARLGRTFNVSVVDISAAPITDAGLAHLSKLTELKSLYILHTPITDAGLAHFEGLSKLQYLFLGHTQVTDAGVAKLRQALPNCNIFPGSRVEKR